MMSFREWLDAKQHVKTNSPLKGWKAAKSQVMKHWTQLPPGRPMAELRTIPYDHKGPTYSYDGLRVTGSPNFIDAVLSRLKDLLAYEGNDTHLQVIYKQQVNSRTEQPIPESYVFYLQVKQAGTGSTKLPKPQRI